MLGAEVCAGSSFQEGRSQEKLSTFPASQFVQVSTCFEQQAATQYHRGESEKPRTQSSARAAEAVIEAAERVNGTEFARRPMMCDDNTTSFSQGCSLQSEAAQAPSATASMVAPAGTATIAAPAGPVITSGGSANFATPAGPIIFAPATGSATSVAPAGQTISTPVGSSTVMASSGEAAPVPTVGSGKVAQWTQQVPIPSQMHHTAGLSKLQLPKDAAQQQGTMYATGLQGLRVPCSGMQAPPATDSTTQSGPRPMQLSTTSSVTSSAARLASPQPCMSRVPVGTFPGSDPASAASAALLAHASRASASASPMPPRAASPQPLPCMAGNIGAIAMPVVSERSVSSTASQAAPMHGQVPSAAQLLHGFAVSPFPGGAHGGGGPPAVPWAVGQSAVCSSSNRSRPTSRASSRSVTPTLGYRATLDSVPVAAVPQNVYAHAAVRSSLVVPPSGPASAIVRCISPIPGQQPPRAVSPMGLHRPPRSPSPQQSLYAPPRQRSASPLPGRPAAYMYPPSPQFAASPAMQLPGSPMPQGGLRVQPRTSIGLEGIGSVAAPPSHPGSGVMGSCAAAPALPPRNDWWGQGAWSAGRPAPALSGGGLQGASWDSAAGTKGWRMERMPSPQRI